MKIILIKSVIIKGHQGTSVGDVLEVDNRVANDLIVEGNAREYVAPAPETIQTREPEVLNRDITPETQPDKSAKRRSAK
jgi:hypothetical protein